MSENKIPSSGTNITLLSSKAFIAEPFINNERSCLDMNVKCHKNPLTHSSMICLRDTNSFPNILSKT